MPVRDKPPIKDPNKDIADALLGDVTHGKRGFGEATIDMIPKHTHITELRERIKENNMENRVLRKEIKRREIARNI